MCQIGDVLATIVFRMTVSDLPISLIDHEAATSATEEFGHVPNRWIHKNTHGGNSLQTSGKLVLHVNGSIRI